MYVYIDKCFSYGTAISFLLLGARAIQASAPSALRPSHVGKSMTTSASASPAFFALAGSCLLSGKLVSCVKYSERTPRHLGFVWINGSMYVYICIYRKSARDPVFAFSPLGKCSCLGLPGISSCLGLPANTFIFLLSLRSGGAVLWLPGNTFTFGCAWSQGGYVLKGHPI